MESSRDEGITPKITPKDFIRTVNGCLNRYYRDPRSSFGSLSCPVTFSHRMMTKEDLEESTRSRSFVCIFQDLTKANHWHQAVHFLLNCLDSHLPPASVIQKLLDTMLVIDDESFIVEAQLYLQQLITFYPPKTDVMAYYYWEIFKEEGLEQKRVSSPKDPCGSFINVLHQLEVELTNLDQKNNNSNSIAINVSCVNEEQNVNKVNTYEDEEDNADMTAHKEELLELCDATILTGKYLKLWWAKATCEQRINRLLYLIYTMNAVFQLDIDVWKKRSQEAQKHPLANPIINRLIWQYDDGNPSSMIVKMIVSMYAICHRNELYKCVTQLEQLINFIALTLPSSPLDQGEGYPPDSHQRRVFAQHIATALLDSGVSANKVDIALARLTPDWLRLIVGSKIHSNRSNQSCGDLPLNVAQLAHMIVQGLSWGDEGHCSDCSSMSSDEEEPSTSTVRKKRKGVKRNGKGETQLHVLARTGKSEKLSELLVKEGSSINLQDYAGWSAVHEAVSHGQLECVRVLCQYKPEVEKHRKKLHKNSGKSEIGESSKAIGTSLSVNLHVKGGDMGLTPLHEAVIQNQIRIADLLLKFGGSSLLNDTTNAGLTPLDLASNDKMLSILKSRKEEDRIVEKKWLSEMKSNVMQLPYIPSDRNCISLRCMLLQCYLETHCLFDIAANLKKIRDKPSSTKSPTIKNIDYLEKSHDLKALQYFQKCLKSHLCGRITLPEAYLLVFLC